MTLTLPFVTLILGLALILGLTLVGIAKYAGEEAVMELAAWLFLTVLAVAVLSLPFLFAGD